MPITDEELQRRLKRLDGVTRVAGPNDPIYSSGLQRSSVPGLPRSTSTSPKNTDGASQKADSPSNSVARTKDIADGMDRQINERFGPPLTPEQEAQEEEQNRLRWTVGRNQALAAQLSKDSQTK